MIKKMFFITRKEGLTHEQFREYYETVHVPLVIASLPKSKRYVRNYFLPSAGSDWAYDAAAEVWYETEEDAAAAAAFSTSQAGRELVNDMARFMNSSSIKTFTVVEIETDFSAGAPRASELRASAPQAAQAK